MIFAKNIFSDWGKSIFFCKIAFCSCVKIFSGWKNNFLAKGILGFVNSYSLKNRTTTETPVVNETAPAQSQTFNVSITASNLVATDNGPVYETIDFGNFEVIINGNAHVTSELSGWAVKNWDDNSYDVNILIPLEAQDANKSYDFEIKCPDKVKAATITNVNVGDYVYPFNFTVNNGTINGTATAVSEQVVVEGSSLWIFFNVNF